MTSPSPPGSAPTPRAAAPRPLSAILSVAGEAIGMCAQIVLIWVGWDAENMAVLKH